MKDEQKQTTTTYTDTFAPTSTSIIDSQWGADEAAELLGWEEEDDEDYDDYEEEDKALHPECYFL